MTLVKGEGAYKLQLVQDPGREATTSAALN